MMNASYFYYLIMPRSATGVTLLMEKFSQVRWTEAD